MGSFKNGDRRHSQPNGFLLLFLGVTGSRPATLGTGKEAAGCRPASLLPLLTAVQRQQSSEGAPLPAPACPSGWPHPAAHPSGGTERDASRHGTRLGVSGGRQNLHPPPRHGSPRRPDAVAGTWGTRRAVTGLGDGRELGLPHMGTAPPAPRGGHGGPRTGAGSTISTISCGGDPVTGAGGSSQALPSAPTCKRARVNANRFGEKKGGFEQQLSTAGWERANPIPLHCRAMAAGGKPVPVTPGSWQHSDRDPAKVQPGTRPGPSPKQLGFHFRDQSSLHKCQQHPRSRF